MKQFLRFQLSGITCLFWPLVLVAASVRLDVVSWDAKVVTAALVVALGLTLAIGVLIHEMTISLHSPFRAGRSNSHIAVSRRRRERCFRSISRLRTKPLR